MIRKFIIFLFLLIAGSFAAEPAGTIQSIIGSAEQNLSRAPGWKPARVRAKVFLNDQLRTGTESSAELRWVNGGVLRMAEQSTMAVRTVIFSLGRFFITVVGLKGRRADFAEKLGSFFAVVVVQVLVRGFAERALFGLRDGFPVLNLDGLERTVMFGLISV
jgi:hypothetical protein